MNESNVPMRWDEELAKSARDVASLERPALSQISLRAGMMSYQKQPVPGNKMDVVVLTSVFENKYFVGAFNPDKYEAPVCYALSIDGENMAPHEDSKEPQDVSCSTCPKSKWGSASVPGGRQSKGKACKEARRLGLIPADALKAGNIATAELAVLSVPSTSLKNWANYVNGLAAEYSRPPWGVLTEVSVVPDAKTMFQVKFQVKGLIEDDSLSAVFKRIAHAQEVLLTPYDDSGVVAQAPDPMPNRKY